MELVHEVGAAVGAAAAAGRGDAAAAGGGDQGVGRETQARIYKKNRCRCEKKSSTQLAIRTYFYIQKPSLKQSFDIVEMSS